MGWSAYGSTGHILGALSLARDVGAVLSSTWHDLGRA